MAGLKQFAKDTAERAVKTVAQAALSTIGVATLGIVEVDWQAVASVSALAGVISVLTSIVSRPLGSDDSASLVAPAGKHSA